MIICTGHRFIDSVGGSRENIWLTWLVLQNCFVRPLMIRNIALEVMCNIDL